MAGSIFEQFMQGRNLAQQQALNQLEMAQQQQMFPIEQQLKQLDIQRRQQQIQAGELAQQRARQELQILQDESAQAAIKRQINNISTLGDLARGAKGLEGDDLAGYISTIAPILGQIDPNLAKTPIDEITPDELENLDIASRALRRSAGNEIQQAKYIEGLGFVQQLKSGEVRLQELTPDQKNKVEQATKMNAELKADAVRKTTEAREGAKTLQKFKTDLNDNAFQARRFIPKIERLREAVRTVKTGVTQQAKTTLGRFLPGVDPSDEQALNAALNDLIFDELARFKGALSDGERAFAKETTTNMGITTEANLLILDRLHQRSIDAIDEQEQFKGHLKAGGSIEDFQFSPRAGFLPSSQGSTTDDLSNLSDDELMRQIQALEGNQ